MCKIVSDNARLGCSIILQLRRIDQSLPQVRSKQELMIYLTIMTLLLFSRMRWIYSLRISIWDTSWCHVTRKSKRPYMCVYTQMCIHCSITWCGKLRLSREISANVMRTNFARRIRVILQHEGWKAILLLLRGICSFYFRNTLTDVSVIALMIGLGV